MEKSVTKIYSDYERVKLVLRSCNTYRQVLTAKKYIRLFYKKHIEHPLAPMLRRNLDIMMSSLIEDELSH